MNDITKSVIKRILELNIEGMQKTNGGVLFCKKGVLVGNYGDVNFANWHNGTLHHEYFKFSTTNTEAIKIKTQEQADEFVAIVANYFGAEENKKPTKEVLPPTRKLTRSERLQQVYNDVLGEIVEELEKEFGKGFEIREREITKDDAIIAFLVGEFLEVFDSEFIEINGCVQVPIDEVKVCKPLNVAEELCKIEMPGNLRLAKNVYGRVVLKCGTISIDTIYYEPTRKIYSSKLFVKKQQEELYKKFGSVLKPEQGKEFVEWVAEALGGEYDV